jgi:HlyD family secretion protein
MTELVIETVESSPPQPPPPPAPSRAPAVTVAITILVIVAVSLWYLVQPQPLLVQGEADGTRMDISARVDGRVLERPVGRGQNVTAGQILVTIDNPELLTRLKEAEAAKAVAEADFKRILVGTRVEVVNSRRAALAAAEANARLAEQIWNRTKQLTTRDFASVQKLDEATANLDVARRSQQQAKLAIDEAIAGYTAEERGQKIAARVTGLRPLGEFATWRAARAVGDHDLNSFRLRLDPIASVEGLRAGMTVWLASGSK